MEQLAELLEQNRVILQQNVELLDRIMASKATVAAADAPAKTEPKPEPKKKKPEPKKDKPKDEPKDDTGYTMAQVQKRVADFFKEHGQDETVRLLSGFNAKKVSDLDPDIFGDLMAWIEEFESAGAEQ